MNKEWHTTPKCTVAETVGHRIVLTSKFRIWQKHYTKAEVQRLVNLYLSNTRKSTRAQL